MILSEISYFERWFIAVISWLFYYFLIVSIKRDWKKFKEKKKNAV
jgi:hypothetical protein